MNQFESYEPVGVSSDIPIGKYDIRYVMNRLNSSIPFLNTMLAYHATSHNRGPSLKKLSQSFCENIELVDGV